MYRRKGWDFRQYKKASLARRISKRLNALKIHSYNEYRLFLESDPAEYNKLFSNITIKVSEFFRDQEVFDFLKGAVKSFFPYTEGLKVWCCGCACGEEAYSVAILLSGCLTPDALRNTKVFATDIDNEALEQARRGVYMEGSLRNVDGPALSAYFFRAENGYKVEYNIRNLLKFGTLDIVRSPSISGVHILLCRNLFIYFSKPLQRTVFEKLDYALKPGGLLVLGKAEVIPPSFAHRYMPVGERTSLYRKRT